MKKSFFMKSISEKMIKFSGSVLDVWSEDKVTEDPTEDRDWSEGW